MNTINTQAPQAANSPPNYGSILGDWTFCQTKESYLAFVREWKETYKLLSRHIRYERLEHKYSCARNLQKIERLAKQLGATEKPALSPWLKQSIAAANWKQPFTLFPGRDTYYETAVANWLLWVRKEAKKQAQASYLKSRQGQSNASTS